MKKNEVSIKSLKILQLMRDMDYNPIKELILMVQASGAEELEIPQKIRIHTELAGYCAPKLKSVEISSNLDGELESIKIVKYSEDIKRSPEIVLN